MIMEHHYPFFVKQKMFLINLVSLSTMQLYMLPPQKTIVDLKSAHMTNLQKLVI